MSDVAAVHDSRLRGKRAIVTGAGSGIGRASARLFAAHGAGVLAVDRDEAAVAKTIADIRQSGGNAVAVAADAGSEADVAGFVAHAVKTFGGIDIFFLGLGPEPGDASHLAYIKPGSGAIARIAISPVRVGDSTINRSAAVTSSSSGI